MMRINGAKKLRSASGAALLAGLILIAAVSSAAQGAAAIYRVFGHPSADAMGFVGEVQGTSAIPPVSSPPAFDSPYPYQTGWPLNIGAEATSEGPLLVNADTDLQLEVLFAAGLKVYLLDHDGSYLPGWPVDVVEGNSLSGQAAFGDLDGDGEGEVVVTSHNWPNGSQGWTHAYHVDGTPVEGFPLLTGGDHSRSPTVVDLDGDGSCEVIVGERDYPIGRVYVCDGSGQVLTGWPQEMDHVPASSAGAADIDNDGIREIVYESYQSVYAYESDGSLVEGFPYTPTTGDVFSYSAPVFADTDGDGFLEIAVGGHSLSGSSHMFLLNHDGTDCAGWPNPLTYWIYAPATIIDMDCDGDLELMVGDQVLSGTPTNRMYVWHHDGTPADGWPVGPVDAVNAQAAAADIDGDADLEFIWDTNITPGKLMGYHHTADPIDGWPITTDGTTFFNTAALGDVDLDQDPELLVLTQLEESLCTVHMWDIPDVADSTHFRMPMFQYGPGRDGEYVPVPAQGVEAADSRMQGDARLSAFPNPFSGQVTILPPENVQAVGSLRIYDMHGRLVVEVPPTSTRSGAAYVWNGSSAAGRLPAGIYAAGLRCSGIEYGAVLLKL